jgi:hypothetical protein
MRHTKLTCNHPQLDALLPRIKGFLDKDVSEYTVMGSHVRGYRSPDGPSLWLRDHSDMMRGFRYWEHDMKSMIDYFAETQTRRGWFFDYVTQIPEKLPSERENWAKHVRVAVEADVEYRFVNAVYLAWQATGDDRWMKQLLPSIERALDYILHDPWRWDRKHRLVKRAFTVDTWDFDYTAGRHPWLNFQITDDTFWGIMHGDNSGYYEAFLRVAALYEHLRNRKRADVWRRYAAAFRRRANALCFNGRFYTHHVHLVPVTIPGVDESEQLSLSNPMDINRGMATHEMAKAILLEYERRGKSTGAFAEWFSIDPPFPDGILGDEKIVRGAYCNGGIMPLVGGELARAAFEHGFEEYGVRQLLTYADLTRDNEAYLWYFPDGRHATREASTSPEAYPTDGWGSSAMLYALMEGLAGVVDTSCLFREVTLAPRWVAANRNEAEVSAMYGASGASLSYVYAHNPGRRTIDLKITGEALVNLHVLLPSGTRRARVSINGRTQPSRLGLVEQSPYVDCRVRMRKPLTVSIHYES